MVDGGISLLASTASASSTATTSSSLTAIQPESSVAATNSVISASDRSELFTF